MASLGRPNIKIADYTLQQYEELIETKNDDKQITPN
jgi:hypothetical protein